MRNASIFAALVCLMTGHVCMAQTPSEKPKPGASRFSDDAIALFAAITQRFDLNGKTTPATADIAVIKRMVQSKDPEVRELARFSCKLIYLHTLLRQLKPDAEITKIAKEGDKDFVMDQLEKTFKDKVKPEELQGLEYGVKAFVALGKGDFRSIETLVFTKPQEQANWTSLVRIFGQGQSVIMKEKMLSMAGQPVRPLPEMKTPLKLKLETGEDEITSVVFTNQTKTSLKHCLVVIRAFNDPEKVDKIFKSTLAKYGAAANILEASDRAIEAGTMGAILQVKMLNIERGGVIYVPAIPADGAVRVSIMSAGDAELLKNVELSLFSDELTVKSLDTGKLKVALVGGAGTPVKLDKNGATQIKFVLNPKGPRDPLAEGNKMARTFSLPMTAGKTYIIQVTTQQYGTDLRVENSEGKTEVKSKETTAFNNKTLTLEYTPTADGDYRIICSEAYSGLPFLLNIKRK